MLSEYQQYLTIENIYLWANLGVLPFWVMLIALPNSKFTSFFVNSIILPLILSTAYAYIVYQTILSDGLILESFQLYLSIENLYTLFANESFLLIFWLHFLALNLFFGSWISRDGVKYNIPRGVVFFPLILVYFIGPIGLVLYWIIICVYAKKIGFHD